MSEKPIECGRVLFFARYPLALNDSHLAASFGMEQYLDDPLEAILVGAQQCKDQYLKLAHGVFLLEEDKCFPAILQMMNHCHEKKFPFLISKLSDSPLSMSPHGQGWQEWLQNKQVKFRLTKFPPPQGANRPA